MKNRVMLFVLAYVLISSIAIADPFTRWQVTTSSTKQTDPVMVGDSIFYREWVSGSESNVWVHSISNNTDIPVIERLSEKNPISASEKYLLYNEYKDSTNWYDIGLRNNQTDVDMVLATGSENQVGFDMWQNRIVYTTGFTWPDLYLYDTDTSENKLLVKEAIHPKIWGDNIVYMKSFGFGYSTVEIYNIKTGITSRIVDSNGYNQTQPDIYKDIVVYAEGIHDNTGIFYKNIITGEVRKVADSGEFPVIWGDLIAWNSSGNILAYNIHTRETFKLSDDMSITGTWEPYGTPFIYENTVLWTSGSIDGYGDIFAADIRTVPEASSAIAFITFLCGGGLLAFRHRKK
jgi:hypothetical protein